MPKDKRGDYRRPLERMVWIDVAGAAVTECALGDMSDKGARLVFFAPTEVPAEFVLRLTEDGRVARKCKVVWRSDKEIGVEFMARRVNGTFLESCASKAQIVES